MDYDTTSSSSKEEENISTVNNASPTVSKKQMNM